MQVPSSSVSVVDVCLDFVSVSVSEDLHPFLCGVIEA